MKLQVNLSQMWITVSSLLLSFVFIFGNSIRTIYESAIFLFVVHPFDVGDQVLIAPNNDLCTVRPQPECYLSLRAHVPGLSNNRSALPGRVLRGST